jgi:hypothetical protein
VEKCRVVPYEEFRSMRTRAPGPIPSDLYFCAGSYDPIGEKAALIADLL